MVKFDRFKVFLYYRDLEGAKHFYREILGLPEHRGSDHVWQYWVTSNSMIGLVEDGHGLPA
jgi:catechol-2,3-dioxygenase